jgi:hypothetical protein
MRFDPINFRLQSLDAGGELLDRQRVEILLAQFRQGIARLAWKKIVDVHSRHVDSLAPQVNKTSSEQHSANDDCRDFLR